MTSTRPTCRRDRSAGSLARRFFRHQWLRLALIVGGMGLPVGVAAQAPVAVQAGATRYEADAGGVFRVRLQLDIESPFHIYGLVTSVGPRGQGPMATSVTLVSPSTFTLAGALTTSPPRKYFDPNFDVEVVTLENKAWIEVPLRAKEGTPPGEHRVELVVGFQACTDQSCLPPGEIKVPVVVVKAVGAPPGRAARTADDSFAEFRTVAGAAVTVLNDRTWHERLGPLERDALMAAGSDLTVALGEKVLADHPTDPRRWSVIATMLRARRQFTGDGADPRRLRWKSRRDALRDELVASAEAPDSLVAGVLELAVYASLGGRWADPGDRADEEAAVRAADRLLARVPGSERRKFAEQHLIEHLIAKQDWGRAEARLQLLSRAREANAPVATMAEGVLRRLSIRREPLEMRFVALDGRPLDLATLRGRVVLIDFWATWCAPCMEEMPEIKRVYAAYRASGFEIVGISFDSLPRDPSKPRAQEKTAEQVKAFLDRETMTWPQHFDGKGWDTEWGRAFSIAELPTGFLLDRSGRLVHLDNHGRNLEKNVRRLLGLGD